MKSLREVLGDLADDRGLSPFQKAFVAADRLNEGNYRKQTTVPYISHLMAVSASVMEDGGDEDERIAALLHDTIEDQQVAPGEIADIFGAKVAEIVESCSDTDTFPKPPWRKRKKKYLAHFEHASDGAVRVALADKLHNAGRILADSEQLGEDIWKRFNATKDEQRWYFTEIVQVMSKRSTSPMVGQLRSVVDQLFGEAQS